MRCLPAEAARRNYELDDVISTLAVSKVVRGPMHLGLPVVCYPQSPIKVILEPLTRARRALAGHTAQVYLPHCNPDGSVKWNFSKVRTVRFLSDFSQTLAEHVKSTT